MAITYVATIKAQTDTIIKENLGLLDQMNEGIIIVDRNAHQFNFCSKPAFSIFNGGAGHLDAPSIQIDKYSMVKTRSITAQQFSKTKFRPMNFKITRASSFGASQDAELSLTDILH